ncbi:MAG: hypothetical protein ACLTIF_03945 [Lachnospiraceae bacterium]|jgi:hypothetical protein|uniref:hypothetical protein n=1 Tax=Eisenbergiella sp. TaxID=1924109 RepID=UPI00206AFAA7|nr:MAG TPA: hypothetical protein [Caudoviricetes sp.]
MRKTNELIEMNIRTMERLTDTLNSVVATMIEMKNELIETRRIQNELVERVGSIEQSLDNMNMRLSNIEERS